MNGILGRPKWSQLSKVALLVGKNSIPKQIIMFSMKNTTIFNESEFNFPTQFPGPYLFRKVGALE